MLRSLVVRERGGSRAEREQRAGRVRRSAAIGVVGLLAIAWFVTARVGNGDALAQNGEASASAPTTVSTASDAWLRARVPLDAQCHDQDRSSAPMRCSVAGVDVEYRRVTPSAVDARYRAAIGTAPATRGTKAGTPACARGAEEERAWARPGTPNRASGRYACRVEGGRAAMWWTVAEVGLLAHATASNADLGTLFAWWASHSER